MAKLIADQKTVKELFENKKSDFLIPDYQRPYAWTEIECQTLWEDIQLFAFPDDNCDKFNNSDEYFLGPIVTFRNQKDQIEVIDGQQRLTTLMLLLRAIYEKLKYSQFTLKKEDRARSREAKEEREKRRKDLRLAQNFSMGLRSGE